MAVINFGEIQAIVTGATPPTNTNMIWGDNTGASIVHKSYDSVLASWVPIADTVLGTSATSFYIGPVEANRVRIKNEAAGAASIRNWADSAYGDLTVKNLTVKGTTTTVESETVTIADNIIDLNSNVTGAPSENAGVRIIRGTSTNASLLWDESNDVWKVGLEGSEQEIITVADGVKVSGTPADNQVAIWINNNTIEGVTALQFNGTTLTANGYGSGDISEVDLKVGGTYGITELGSSTFGRTNRVTGNMDLDGTVILINKTNPTTSNILFAMLDNTNSFRFALPKSGVGNATYNPRSMLLAGPTVNDDTVVTVGYWQTNNSIFHNLACDTSGSGADLGVQNDLEVEGDIFTDSIKSSTDNTTITITPHGTGGVLIDGSRDFDYNPTTGNLIASGAAKAGSIGGTDYGYNLFFGPSSGLDAAASVTDFGWNVFLGESNRVLGANANVNNAFIVGYNNRINGAAGNLYSAFMMGTENEIDGGGTAPTIFGASGKVSGSYSTTGGVYGNTSNGGIAWGKGFNATDRMLISSGLVAINFSTNLTTQTAGHGALGDYTGIFAGVDHNIPADSPRTVIVGGNAIKAAAATADTVYVPLLRIGQGTGATLTQNDAETQVAVIDSSTGEIKWRAASTLSGAVISGTPSNKQISYFTNSTTIAGSGDFTWDDSSSTLQILAGATVPEIQFGGSGSLAVADSNLASIWALWGGSNIAARINIKTGVDTINKDDGQIELQTSETGGSLNTQLKIAQDGTININGTSFIFDPVLTTGNSGGTFTVQNTGNSSLVWNTATPLFKLATNTNHITSEIENTSATTGDAILAIRITNGATTGDPQIRFENTGDNQYYSMGIDTSDSDSFKITQNTSTVDPSSGTTRLTLTTAGYLTIGASRLGFFSATAIAKPTITGSRGGNAALASLLTELANYGLVTDSTT